MPKKQEIQPRQQASTDLQVIGRHLLAREARLDAVLDAKARARGLTARRVITQLGQILRDNEMLKRCTPDSLIKVCEQACMYGMEIGGPLPQAYVVPYKGSAVFQIGYRGLIRLVVDSGAATEVGVEFVYEGDVFRREMGIGGTWTHEANQSPGRESRPITHVYSEFRLPNGHIKRWAMTKDEINEHATQHSQSFGQVNSPWSKNWKAMAAKTVLKQPIIRGLLPITVDEQFMDVPAEACDDGGEIFDMQEASQSDVQPPAQIQQSFDAKGNPAASEHKKLNLEQLDLDLAMSKSEEEVEDVRRAYLGGADTAEAVIVKECCVKRIEQLMQAAEE